MTARVAAVVAAGLLIWPRPQVDLVQIHAVVETATHQVAKGLGPGDFLVLADGLPVTIATAAVDAAPLSAVLLADVTASMHVCPNGVAGIPSTARRSTGSQFPGPIPPAVEPFLIYGLQSGDRVRTGPIGRDLRLDAEFTANANDIRKRWRAVFAHPPIDWLGPSPVWDAVAAALDAVANEPGHRAIIVISDGAATGNLRGRRDVAARAARAGVPVSVVAEQSVTRLAASAEGDAIDPSVGLADLADETGGVAVLDPAMPDETALLPGCFKHQTETALQSVLARLHGAYLLSFPRPDVNGRPATLEVRVKKPGLAVTAAPKTVPAPRQDVR